MRAVVRTNGQVSAKALGYQESLKRARAAVLKAVPPATPKEIFEVVDAVAKAHPELRGEDIQGGVWTLLAGGNLRLTEDQRVTRAK